MLEMYTSQTYLCPLDKGQNKVSQTADLHCKISTANFQQMSEWQVTLVSVNIHHDILASFLNTPV